MKIFSLGFAAAAVIGAVMFTGAANAAPMMATGAQAGQVSSENMIIQVQRGNRGGARAFGGGGNRGGGVARGGGGARAFGGGGGGRGFARGGGRGFGGAGAAIGLGILGAAVIGGVAAQSCWRRQAVVDPYGDIVGYRRVYVC